MKITTLKRRSTAALLASCLGVIALIGVACGGDDPAGGPSRAEFDRLDDQVETLEGIVQRLAGVIGMLPGTMMPPTTTPDPDPPAGGGDFLHATFDNSTEIQENIADGTTFFRIDQQQPLQGYGSVVALALERYYGIVPASELTLTGPGIVTQAQQASGAVPTRWFFNQQTDAGANTLNFEQVRERAGDLDFIAIQHAECAYDAFWCVVQEGITQAAEDTGVNVDIRAPLATESSNDVLAGLVNTARGESPDGILLTYTHPDNQAFRSAVEAAVDAGIPVVAYNAGNGRNEDGVGYLTVYNQDEEEAGRQAARRLIAAAEAADITPVGICINHEVGNTSTDARCDGFAEVFNANSDATLAGDDGVLQTSANATESVQTITEFFGSNDNVNVFLTLGPNSAHPFYTFYEERGLSSDNVVHGTFDTSNIINENIRNGNTEFGIDQQPFLQGYAAVTALYTNALFNVNPVASRSLTGPGFITTGNIDSIPADVAGYRNARGGDNADLEFGIIHHGASTNAWWVTMNDTIRLAAQNLGVEVDFLLPTVDEDAAMVRDNIVSAAARQFDGVATTISANNFGDPIEDLLDPNGDGDNSDGIPVVAFNAGNGPTEDEIGYRTYIGQTEYQAGYQGGQALAREVTRSGLENPLAICFNQTVGLANLDARCRGFTDAMNEANIPLAGDGVLNVGTEEVAATAAMSQWFAGNQNANIFFTLGPQVAASFYDFIEEVGLN